MKYISIIICLALFSCHDVKVGYLETEAAQYNPNVLEVTKRSGETVLLTFPFTTIARQELIKSAYRWKTRTTQPFLKTFLPSW